MKYVYRIPAPLQLDAKGKYIKRPMVEIEIFGAKGKMKQLALIDSGADVSLFNYEIAEFIGIDLSNAKKFPVIGVTGMGEFDVVDEVEIKVEHLEKTKIPVGFIKSQHVAALLGQEGFFDHNRIRFEKDHDTFEIIPVKGK
ncbi:MAG: retroviral-like aspartic protease family protein [Parcubacteria group bacterium]|nr:retroviral-like aspartic protease family protein [Parcubacteria group bacterium]MBI3074616.1 retroviral-like aspartic protease family protein [Parcubacteria group bacterium]